MKIHFCGAAGTTTGSQHLLEINGNHILLDCGLYQGRRQEAYERNQNFPFDAAKVDVVVLSHAHIDHSGNLPNLVKRGFRGNIVATAATRDLCSIMLPDSAHIQESDIDYVNRHRKKSGQPPVGPIYSLVDAQKALRQFTTVEYDRPTRIADGVTMTFIDAGHILGSAQVVLDIEDRADGKKKRLLFSGDIGRPGSDLLNDAAPCEDVDTIIMESTYGGRRHELPPQTSERICEIINKIIERRSRLIIPAFAVERTQQLLYTMDKLRSENCFPRVPIFVDSPLAVRATEIFRMHTGGLREEVREALFMQDDPFGFEGLRLVRTVEESKNLNRMQGPLVIISASGMAESGRILHHLKNNVSHGENIILFVGYCAENTLGWKLREGWHEVTIFGEPHTVNADVETLDSFSGHADHDELLAWFDRITGPKQQVFLVHGEADRAALLQKALAARHPSGKIVAPARLNQMTV
jgi:metallo-beta-lactamase family protein